MRVFRERINCVLQDLLISVQRFVVFAHKNDVLVDRCNHFLQTIRSTFPAISESFPSSRSKIAACAAESGATKLFTCQEGNQNWFLSNGSPEEVKKCCRIKACCQDGSPFNMFGGVSFSACRNRGEDLCEKFEEDELWDDAKECGDGHCEPGQTCCAGEELYLDLLCDTTGTDSSRYCCNPTSVSFLASIGRDSCKVGAGGGGGNEDPEDPSPEPVDEFDQNCGCEEGTTCCMADKFAFLYNMCDRALGGAKVCCSDSALTFAQILSECNQNINRVADTAINNND